MLRDAMSAEALEQIIREGGRAVGRYLRIMRQRLRRIVRRHPEAATVNMVV